MIKETPEMTESVVEQESVEKPAVTPPAASDEQLVAMFVDRARSEGLQLTGEGGLLQMLTKRVLESALEGEITDHLGYEKHDAGGRNSGNSRNGTRAKTVLTDVGPVEVKVPRDVAGTFEPQIVKKRQRRLTGVDEMVLSLSAKGLTHGEFSAHLAEVYGAEISQQTISTITDKVMEGMAEWSNRPLDRVCPVLFVDAINVKIRDGQVANRPVYVVMAVTTEGTRDILGIWAGDGGEGAKYWLHVFTELKNRGIDDVLMLVCDGLKGLPEAVEAVWPRTIVQTCVVHLLRNSFRYAARQDWDKIAKALKRGLHRAERGRGDGAVPGVPGGVGQEVSGDREAVVGRLGRVRALPLLRCRDPQGHLLDQRHRERERPHTQGGAGPRALSERGRGA
jgi:transposase-like protein